MEGLPFGPETAVCRRRLQAEGEPRLLECLAHGRSSQRAGARRRSGARKPCGHAGPELRRRAHPAIARLDAAARKHVLVGHEHLAAGAAAHQDLGPTGTVAQQNERGGVLNPHVSPGSWSARRCPADRAGEARSAMQGHRASASTHHVGRIAPPFGSRPGARPRRRGPQPYSPIRFSARSWRIERLGATQAVTMVRHAGWVSGCGGSRHSHSVGRAVLHARQSLA